MLFSGNNLGLFNLFEGIRLIRYSGNEALHLLTSNKTHKLRIDLEDFNGTKRYAEYSDFRVGSESENYKLLSLGQYNGTAGLSS